MEIQALRVRISEQDLNHLIAKHWSEDLPIEDLVIRVVPEGVQVTGSYPLFVTVSFEALWEPSIAADGRLAVRLARLKALGMPATALKSLVLNLLEKSIKANAWLEVKEDSILVDVDRLLGEEGLQTRTHLRVVRCEDGALSLVAGRDEPTPH
jgi:hypothetical protein